jgi:hypothetical protein
MSFECFLFKTALDLVFSVLIEIPCQDNTFSPLWRFSPDDTQSHPSRCFFFTSLVKEQFIVTQWYSIFCRRQKKRDRSSIPQHFSKAKGKSIPLQAWTGPESYRRKRLQNFKTIGTWRWQGCQPYAPAAFTPQKLYLILISVGIGQSV